MQNRLNWLKHSLSYAVAALVVAPAVIANLLMETYLQASPTLFLFLCAIIFAGWFGAVGPGLAATALSILAFDYFFLPPIYSIDLLFSDLPRIALFMAAALFVVGLIATQRNTAESLLRSRADLEDKVRDLERLNTALKINEAYVAEALGIAHIGYWERYPATKLINWSEETLRIFGLLPGGRPGDL
jgi:K+-sensing histidine kinase KdpD